MFCSHTKVQMLVLLERRRRRRRNGYYSELGQTGELKTWLLCDYVSMSGIWDDDMGPAVYENELQVVCEVLSNKLE